jgi:hypothetical protein
MVDVAMPQGTFPDTCYGLDLNCSPKAHVLQTSSQSSSVQKWGLWEVKKMNMVDELSIQG